MKHQDIEFKTRRIQAMKTNDKDQQEIEKETRSNKSRRSPKLHLILYPFFLTRRNLKDYQKDEKGTMRLI